MLFVQRRKYEQLGGDRNMATARVLVPEDPMGEQWQLLWTIKRHKDPNGRKSPFPAAGSLLDGRSVDNGLGQFHSATTINPIDHQTHLELETNRKSVSLASCSWNQR